MDNSFVTGIDVSHYSIKAVTLKRVDEAYIVVSYKDIPLTENTFLDNYALNYIEIKNKFKVLKKTLPFFNRKVVVSIPDNAVISKELRVDNEAIFEHQILAIHQEFSQQSSFSIEELILDFIKIDEKEPDSESSSIYQVYATRKEVITTRMLAAKKAGLNIIVMDMQVHGLLYLWWQIAKAHQSYHWLLMDIGFTQTTLCMDFETKTYFYKKIPFGIKTLNITKEIATIHDDPISTSNQVDSIQDMIDKLKQQLQLIYTIYDVQVLSGIKISGSGDIPPQLLKEITVQLDIACELLNPFSFCHQNVASSNHSLEIQRFAIATGLALRGIHWLETPYAT